MWLGTRFTFCVWAGIRLGIWGGVGEGGRGEVWSKEMILCVWVGIRLCSCVRVCVCLWVGAKLGDDAVCG